MEKMKHAVHRLLESKHDEKAQDIPDEMKDFISLGKLEKNDLKPKSTKSLGNTNFQLD